MTVGVWVVAEGDVKVVLEPDQACHGIGGRAVHADLAVLVHGHESEGWVDGAVDHLYIKSEPLGNWIPETQGRSAQWVHTYFQSGFRYDFRIDNVCQVLCVRADVVVLVRSVRGNRLFEGRPAHVLVPFL